MNLSHRKERSLVLTEGMVDWIMERATAEERLAAWDVLVAIAFPEDGERYEPPVIKRGQEVSSIDRTKRDAYNIFNGLIAYKRDTAEEGYSIKAVEAQRKAEAEKPDEPPPKVREVPVVDVLELGGKRRKVRLTAEDREVIEEWNKKFPSAKSLYDYLKINYFAANRSLVCTEDFCNYAYRELVNQKWLSTRTGKPLQSIELPIHYMALRYKRLTGEIRRAEAEERQKDLAAEFEAKAAQYEQQDPTELADIERKRRLQAEKEWEEKVRRGVA